MNIIKEENKGIVTSNSVLELSMKEFNMLLLHKLFETRDYILKHYDLSDFDGVDQAHISFGIFDLRCQYELKSDVYEITLEEMFQEKSFQVAVDQYFQQYLAATR